MTRLERFMEKVTKQTVVWSPHVSTPCWVWEGATAGSGYGQFWNGERTMPAHLFLILIDGRKLNRGQEGCHACDNKLCVRPSHIFIGTRSDNERDKVSKGRHNTAPGCRAMLQIRKVNRGQNNHACKLTEAQALEAKACSHKYGAATALAKRLGVSVTVVCDIRDGKRWTHLK